MTDRINREQLDAFALGAQQAADPRDASIEALVQTITRKAVRRAEASGLDATAVLVALVEAVARIALSSPSEAPIGRIAAGTASLVESVILARGSGMFPGPLDVPAAARTRQ